MAKSIKKTIYKNATARCVTCGSTYTLDMTVETLTLDVCGNCHPFYTNSQTLVDTARRVEKFLDKQAKQIKPAVATSSSKETSPKTKEARKDKAMSAI